ncbi:hypothetical protein [Bradyrhizobium valentinum]|uniref:Uncharacterized protein n=1 Tax=Bradyrhizobium valentinum TaxID=1518501 RepID=A0A0R3LTT1_9BRAD|nr:hypothetical protein [Bradyrhizobium valentinum]KRR08531.1 hypothetical protein CP49_24935 [Bradyrhizobium valentinum]
MDLLEGVLRLFGLIFGWLFGWPLAVFRRWIDRQPDRDPSQISRLEKFGRAYAWGILDALRPHPAGLADLQVRTANV